MKIFIRVLIVIALLLAGFAAGFPIGRSMGFSTGCEWSIIQADILAREAGIVMPINYEKGIFRVIVRQPKHLYKRAWQLADRHDESMKYVDAGQRTLSETACPRQTACLAQ